MSGVDELSLVRLMSLVVFTVAAWSTWTRRATFHSRFDAGITAAAALFGIGALLDAPWSVCATASVPFTGRYYGLMVVAHLCFLAGATASIASVYMRLLPADEFRRIMRTWIVPVAVGSAAIMITTFLMSSLPFAYSVPHLYLATPDTALSLYWYATFGSAGALGGFVSYGVFLLRGDPRSVMGNLMLASAVLASLGCVLVVGWGMISGSIVVLHHVAWFGGYTGFAGFALAAGVQWRHRERSRPRSPHNS